MNKDMSESDSHLRIQSLEERVSYLESIIEQFCQGQNQNQNQNQGQNHYEFDEILETIDINKDHLTQVLKTSMEEQIILIILEENKRRRFMKMTKELSMYKKKWIYMEDSDLKLLIEIIEHKLLLLHSKSSYDQETCFENNKIIYGLNLSTRFKKIKSKLIDML
jgi:hypothetical protein